MQRRKTEPVYTPAATYRLQFNQSFTFQQAAEMVDYLDELGISDLYASPFLMARPGSLHGYDVTDHSRFNPEIGDEHSFLHLSEKLQQRGMGLIVDVVPNHMCISHPSNQVVVGRARERPQQSLRARFRYRMASAQGRAGQ